MRARASLKNSLHGKAIEVDSILSGLVEQVRSSHNAEAKALLSQAVQVNPRATSFDPRPFGDPANGLVLRAITMVNPDAWAPLYDGVTWAKDRSLEALGSHEAPLIRRELDFFIDGQLRVAANADRDQDPPSALRMSLRAWDRLAHLADHVRHPEPGVSVTPP